MSEEKPSLRSKNRVRMRDVANRCGVSISTVSLVLSGDPRIPEDTTRMVLETVKAMEYRPSVVARNLARRLSRTIGVILPQYAFERNQPFYYEALAGIHGETQPNGFKMVVEAASKDFLERRYYLRLLKEQSADAVIFLAAGLNDSYLQEMEKEPYPFVLVGAYSRDLDLLCARGDDELGAKMATAHLIKLGHKKIGHVAGLSESSLGHDRQQGYERALKDAGIKLNPDWIVSGEFDMEIAEKKTGELIKKGVTAIFAGNDVMAHGVLRGLKKAGKNAPQDVAVIGMDDIKMSAWSNPPLSTVRYHIREIAAQAARYVLKQVHLPVVKKDLLGDIPVPELIVRESSVKK